MVLLLSDQDVMHAISGPNAVARSIRRTSRATSPRS